MNACGDAPSATSTKRQESEQTNEAELANLGVGLALGVEVRSSLASSHVKACAH